MGGRSWVLNEARAWLQQARHLGRDWGEVHRTGAGPSVFFVHGVYASPGVFRPLRERLHHDLDANSWSLGFVTGASVEDLALRLSRIIELEPSQAPIHLVGHSLGGLVVRYYVQELGADVRVRSTTSLAAPFRGSRRTGWLPARVARDLWPEGELTPRLALGNARGDQVPHLSIAGADDVLVESPPFPDFGERVTLAGVGHNGLLFDDRVADLLVRRIRLC